MLYIKNLTYRFPGADSDAVRDLSLEIRPGESIAIMGPNGSGKSTLARLIAGLLEPTSGSVAIDGAENANRADQVGMLFQNPDNQMVSVLVDKEIAFALENKALPMAAMEPRVKEILAAFKIAHLEHRVTSYLSGGEKQRVALASLMIDNPPILILDEPDSYLDTAGRGLLRTQLSRLHDRFPDLIEIRVTQYPEVGLAYPRLLLMAEGALVGDGPPDTLSRSEAFRSFVGDQPEIARKSADTIAGQSRLGCSDLTFSYEPDRPLFDQINFEIHGGEAVALLGGTGSGKSTLGLLLAGLLEPDGGEIQRTVDPHQGIPVAAVFQQPERQFFLSTVAEEIAYGPNHHGRHLSPEAVATCLAQVGLPAERYATRDPLSLSMGEKRRLAIGVAIALNPAFLLFDEPTAGLDPEGVARFLDLTRSLRDRGLGIVCISHERRLVEQLTGRVVVLDGKGGLTGLSTSEFLADRQYRSLVWPPDAD